MSEHSNIAPYRERRIIKVSKSFQQRTRDSLQKSVTLAIEITTQSQEAAAKREAERVDQVSVLMKTFFLRRRSGQIS